MRKEKKSSGWNPFTRRETNRASLSEGRSGNKSQEGGQQEMKPQQEKGEPAKKKKKK